MGLSPSIKTRPWLLPLILAILVNSNVLSNQFVWDDLIFLRQQLPGFQNLHDVFFPNLNIPQISKDYYRPLIILTYLWDRKLWGMNPFGYHLTVLLFHLGSTLLVFFLSTHLLHDHPQRTQVSALSSSIFAIHPIHTENVAWMAGRSDIIPAFLMFLSMLCYVKYREREGSGSTGPSAGPEGIGGPLSASSTQVPGYDSKGPHFVAPNASPASGFRFYLLVLSSFSLFLALLSKEVALSLLLLLPLYDHLGRRRAPVWGEAPPKIRPVIYLLPFLALLAYYMMRRAALGNPIGSTRWVSHSDGNLFEDVLLILGFYLKKLLWPFDLRAFIPEIPNSTSHLLLSLLLISFSILLFAWAYWKNRPVIAFTIAWVFITLSPSILVAFTTVSKTPLAERYLYIPSFGFALLAGLFLTSLLESPYLRKGIFRSLKPAIVLLLIGMILGTGAWATFNRNRIWNNSITFWTDLTQKIPEYGLPHNNLGDAYLNAGRQDEAVEEFKLALQLKYENFGKSLASTSLGQIYMHRGQYDLAEQLLFNAIRLKQNNYFPYFSLGMLYFERVNTRTDREAQQTEDVRKALVYLNKSIELNPSFPTAHLYVGRAYRHLGNEDEAIKHFKQVIEISPDPSAESVLMAKRLLASSTKPESSH